MMSNLEGSARLCFPEAPISDRCSLYRHGVAGLPGFDPMPPFPPLYARGVTDADGTASAFARWLAGQFEPGANWPTANFRVPN
jgi:hypothetical protein